MAEACEAGRQCWLRQAGRHPLMAEASCGAGGHGGREREGARVWYVVGLICVSCLRRWLLSCGCLCRDQFPMDVKKCTLVMKTVIEQGGLAPGGLNFDVSPRMMMHSLPPAFRTTYRLTARCIGSLTLEVLVVDVRFSWCPALVGGRAGGQCKVRRESCDVEDMFIAHIGTYLRPDR